MKRNGFTLVELLAVIVILAIILAIAVPSVTVLIRNVTMEAFASDSKLIIKNISYKQLEDNSFDPTIIDETNMTSILGLSVANYESLDIAIVNNKISIYIVGKNKWANFTSFGTYDNITVLPNDELDSANLMTLTLNSGTSSINLSPVFSPLHLIYNATVEYDINSCIVSITREDADATVRVNGTVIVTSSAPVPLTAGVNTPFGIDVQNGSNTKHYTINVTRERNLYLSLIEVRAGRNNTLYPVSPVVSHNDTAYDTNTGTATTASITIQAEDSSNVDIYINSVLGSTSSVNLNIIGVNEIPVIIKSKIDSSEKEYIIRITRTS